MPPSDTLPSYTAEDGQGCLSDAEVLAFAEGYLDKARLGAVHAHLDACETCQHLVSEAAHALVTARTTPLDDSEDVGWNRTFKSGAVVAQRYVVLRFVARGGMGEVYEARDRELNECVALKTVSSTACDNPMAVRRLKAEVQLARRVSHPNVCRIYDLGTHELERNGANIHFLTMEFVEGETLGQRIRLGGPLPVSEAQTLARELLLGLSAAHAAGILHRDFKSDNVMLRPESETSCTPVILDFGLARALDQDARHLTSGTHQHLIGTVDYMAPEQIEGKPYSTASDVYSFGVVLFEMLTASLPFEASSKTASALERLRRNPLAPSKLNPLVPAALDALVLRCLARNPEQRFQTPEAVLEALDALERRFAPPAARNRRLAQIAVTLGVLGIGAFGALAAERAPGAAPPVATSVAPALPALTAPAPSPAQRGGSDVPVYDAANSINTSLLAPGTAQPPARRVTRPSPAGDGRPAAQTPSKDATAPASEAPAGAQAATPESAAAPATAAQPAAQRAVVVSDAPLAPASSGASRKPDWENPFQRGKR